MKIKDLFETAGIETPLERAKRLKAEKARLQGKRDRAGAAGLVYDDDLTDVEQQIKANKRAAANEHNNKATHKSTIAEEDVPKKLPNGKRGFANPYFATTRWVTGRPQVNRRHENLYAGPVENYQFVSTTMYHMYQRLNETLKEHGLAPFTIAYAGDTPAVGSEFAIYGANGRFLWRKYGIGASGQNHVIWILPEGGNFQCQTSILRNPRMFDMLFNKIKNASPIQVN